MIVYEDDWECEKCQLCGAEYRLALWVPDDVWRKITPKPWSEFGGLLCPDCIDRRCKAAGLRDVQAQAVWVGDAVRIISLNESPTPDAEEAAIIREYPDLSPAPDAEHGGGTHD